MACKREKLEKGVKGRDQEGRGEGRGGTLKSTRAKGEGDAARRGIVAARRRTRLNFN